MTIRNEQLIDLDDIEVIRLRCRNAACATAMLIPINDLDKFPYECPTCKTQWAVQNGTTVRMLRDLRICWMFIINVDRAKKKKPGDDDYMGFSVSLEVKNSGVISK